MDNNKNTNIYKKLTIILAITVLISLSSNYLLYKELKNTGTLSNSLKEELGSQYRNSLSLALDKLPKWGGTIWSDLLETTSGKVAYHEKISLLEQLAFDFTSMNAPISMLGKEFYFVKDQLISLQLAKQKGTIEEIQSIQERLNEHLLFTIITLNDIYRLKKDLSDGALYDELSNPNSDSSLYILRRYEGFSY